VASLLRNVKTPNVRTGSFGDGLGILGREFNDCLRLSIAGAQEKTALLWHEGQWLIPHGSTPTTHIFKLPLGHLGIDRRLDLSSSVENEWLCLRILQAYGLNVPKAAMLRFEDQKVLVVERFDRELHKSARWWLRLPQEDFCQVTATPSLLKYESEGGPGMARIANYLQSSQHAERDLADFLRYKFYSGCLRPLMATPKTSAFDYCEAVVTI
jgi:serine/threonine-protein kinase HipA